MKKIFNLSLLVPISLFIFATNEASVGEQVINLMKSEIKTPCIDLLASSDLVDWDTFEKRVQTLKESLLNFETKLNEHKSEKTKTETTSAIQSEQVTTTPEQPIQTHQMIQAPAPQEPVTTPPTTQPEATPAAKTDEVQAAKPEQVTTTPEQPIQTQQMIQAPAPQEPVITPPTTQPEVTPAAKTDEIQAAKPETDIIYSTSPDVPPVKKEETLETQPQMLPEPPAQEQPTQEQSEITSQTDMQTAQIPSETQELEETQEPDEETVEFPEMPE